MVVSLFETGYLTEGAGPFQAFPGQLALSLPFASVIGGAALLTVGAVVWFARHR